MPAPPPRPSLPLRWLRAGSIALALGACTPTPAPATDAPTATSPSVPAPVTSAAGSLSSPAASSHAASPPSAAPEASAAPGGVRYVVAAMGDSLTDPKSHGGKYLDVLRERCPESRFDSYGVGGNMVNQMRKRFLRDVFGEVEGGDPLERPRYTHVLVLGGINDICSDESALRTNDKIKRDLTWMYEQTRAHGAKVYAINLPPWGGFERYYNPRRGRSTQDINRWLVEQRAAGTIDGLLDVYRLMSCGDPEYLCPDYGWKDQVHWNQKGHQVAGEALYDTFFRDCR